jgi:putative DNA primase/helicase
MLEGAGRNGKSTLLEIVYLVLGDHAWNAPGSAFDQNSRSTIPNDLAASAGRRFITCREMEPHGGTRLHEARLKAFTGNDTISARFLFKEHFEFVPVGKVWFCINHPPTIQDDSEGLWRRMRRRG